MLYFMTHQEKKNPKKDCESMRNIKKVDCCLIFFFFPLFYWNNKEIHVIKEQDWCSNKPILEYKDSFLRASLFLHPFFYFYYIWTVLLSTRDKLELYRFAFYGYHRNHQYWIEHNYHFRYVDLSNACFILFYFYGSPCLNFLFRRHGETLLFLKTF